MQTSQSSRSTVLKTFSLLVVLLGSITSITASSSGSGSAAEAAVLFPRRSMVLPPKPLIPNWIRYFDPSDDACYRKMATSCPLSYPVKCGVECIRQNADCGLHVTGNVQAAAYFVINAATSGVFDELQTKFPNSTQEQIVSLLGSSNIVIQDLPIAVGVCLGLEIPPEFVDRAASVVAVVNKVLVEVVAQGPSLLDVNRFMKFIKYIGAGQSVDSLPANDTAVLTTLISEGKIHGTELQSVINKVTKAVAEIKGLNPSASSDEIRVILSNSELFRYEILIVTNNCISNTTEIAYAVRDEIRKVLSVITDHLIDASVDDKGRSLSKADYAIKVANMGLDVVALFDPTGVAAMLREYIQPICSPTSFIGEIDDGSLANALGLRVKGDAFAGSFGNWTRDGDGIVHVVFQSTDQKDVTVVIRSAGKTIAKVNVRSGETVTWSSTVATLQNRALYFDRWRPGMLNVAGSGGGSLVLWVPTSSTGEMVTRINTS